MQTNLPGPIPKGVFYVEKFSSQHFYQKIKRNIPNLQRRCGNRTKSSPWKIGCFPQKLAVNTVFSRAWVLDSRLLSKGTLYNSPCQATRNLRVFNGWFRCSIDLMMTTLALRSCQSCDTWGQSPDPRSVGRKTSSNPGRESNPVRFEKYKSWFVLESDLSIVGGFKDFLCSPRKLGKMIPFWRAYFSDGLVQPPTRTLLWTHFETWPFQSWKLKKTSQNGRSKNRQQVSHWRNEEAWQHH